ncbi:N5-glutamine methyltransferase family protein [Gryllotalpicola reticulitermitis]|uniref:N5-glutamine methyltransferase family protein n=1 Tax=Gryllotalpicola reticulitermitis TaxID=1184153 RepID=A0ABV8Q1E8_9MICO
MFAEDEAELLRTATSDAGQLEQLVTRRVDGEPLEYVLGWAEFAGLRLRVAPGVFVPRRRTELLLRLALASLRGDPSLPHAQSSRRAEPTPRAEGSAQAREAPHVLELCCGVAPVATAVGARMPEASVIAADIDPDAVAVATENLAPLGGRAIESDLFAALPAGTQFDVIVANAPYVPSAELVHMPREAREFEHTIALDGGPDGLLLHRSIAADAAAWLSPGGVVLVETSRRQADADREIFATHGWRVEIVRDDDLDATAVRAMR